MAFQTKQPAGNMTTETSYTNSVDLYPDMAGPEAFMPEMGKLFIIAQQMKMYLFPCLLAGGIPLNIVSVVIFMRTKFRKVTTMHYFIACGITDSIRLCATLVPWLEVYDIWIYSTEGICQIVVYLKHLSEFLSSWYLALALLDNWIGSLCRLSPKRYCTVFKTRALILAVFTLALVALLYLTWTYGPMGVSGKFLCMAIEQGIDAMVVLSVMRIIFASLIPAMAVFVLSILLLTYCGRCRKNKSSGSNKNHILIPLHSHRISQSKSTSNMKINKQCLTTVCLALGSLFMFIAIPRSVIILRLAFLKKESHRPPPMELGGLLHMSEELYNIHFAWKFLIYFIFLKQFRHRLCRCLSLKPKRGARPNVESIVDGDVV